MLEPCKLEICWEKAPGQHKYCQKFTQKSGFKFSLSKTSMLHFTALSIPPPTGPRLSNIRIQKSETVKNLGLRFDSKLAWKAKPQAKCDFNQIRSKQKTSMMFYRSLMRSKRDYRHYRIRKFLNIGLIRLLNLKYSFYN